MNAATWVDVAVGLGVVLVAIAGWRAGVISTVAAFVGFIGGALLGSWLAPQLLAGTAWPPFLRAIATLGGMLLLGLIGQSLLGFVGRTIRDAMNLRPLRLVDSASGMVVSAVAFLLSAWMLLSVAASIPQGTAAEAVRTSRAYPILEQLMSGPAGDLLDDARALLGNLELPSLPFNPSTLPPVDDPGDVQLTDAVRDVARASVVQVSSSSTRCRTSMVGSGIVVGPDRVATNAHVVAGAGRIVVRSSGDRGTHGARLVYLDRATDLAILRVPGLDAPVPEWTQESPRGTEGAVAGYPAGGGLKVREARVRGTTRVPEEGAGTAMREVIVFQGLVQPGNSGGALLGLDGRVLGMVFANSTLNDGIGFALTPAEVAAAVRAASDVTEAVSSGSCPVSSTTGTG